eukprot:TRINITY_DN5879_c0_g1_i5.p2 TRINITY_DN5879_c0_g1~~TRINITY_DN5879_c0_g1_i5.p2  ORF type:complete len:278 (+),score=43.47 TRINITY_DN5879_c0_g1_i5:130-963(+)
MVMQHVPLNESQQQLIPSLHNIQGNQQPLQTPELPKTPQGKSSSKQNHQRPMISTKRAGTNELVTQEQFVQLLVQHPGPGMVDSLFQISKPRRRTTRRSNFLQLSEDQEAVLYGLVNCADVGWSIRNIKKPTREFAEQSFGINKRLLHLFFKNRAQRKRQKGEKREGEAEADTGGEGGEGGLLQQFQETIGVVQGNSYIQNEGQGEQGVVNACLQLPMEVDEGQQVAQKQDRQIIGEHHIIIGQQQGQTLQQTFQQQGDGQGSQVVQQFSQVQPEIC